MKTLGEDPARKRDCAAEETSEKKAQGRTLDPSYLATARISEPA